MKNELNRKQLNEEKVLFDVTHLLPNKLNWKHIMDERPKPGEMIIQIDAPYDGHYPMGMREYSKYSEYYMKFCLQNDLHPNWWWISAKDFPFPLERQKSP